MIIWYQEKDYHKGLTLPGNGRDSNTEHSGASAYSNSFTIPIGKCSQPTDGWRSQLTSPEFSPV